MLCPTCGVVCRILENGQMDPVIRTLIVGKHEAIGTCKTCGQQRVLATEPSGERASAIWRERHARQEGER